MSVKVYKTQTYRPYKIEVYGLQDDYIGTLQSYDDSFLGRVQDPKVSISGDGSQEFTCSVPRFYINPKTNEKLINPRWGDIINGVLAENTRVLKVFVETDGEKKVYPFIVDKIIDKRDSHFSVFKEITGNGLAFAELGKVGLKLELNSRTVELEQEANKDKEIVPTLQYWLDKVFPRDESGRWLTPWCYEIRMDWSQYSDKENRLPTKMYSDAYVNNWTIEGNELVPSTIQSCQEKARMIDCSENGNKYNITQTLAETFGVFCNYEYKCAENGSFIKEYTDEKGNVWKGRKVIFYNRAIKTDKPFMMEYQKNLQSISRTCETDEIYSKLYVTPIESSVMTDGYVTIANTEANPLLDEFILNFDYLYEKGAINDYQKEYIANYEAEIHASNAALLELSKEIEEIMVEINDKKAEEAGYEKSISAAKEQLVHYQTLRDNEVTNTPVVKDYSNSFSVVFVTDKETTYAKIRLEGVAPGSIVGYTDYKYEKKLFDSSRLITVREQKPVSTGDENIYVVVDEDGYATALYTAKNNLLQDDPVSQGQNAGFLVYLALEYSPYNKYVDICKRFENIIDKESQKKEEVNSIIKEKENLLDFYTTLQNNHIKQKKLLNQKLEKLLGPALREGYWTPEGYEEVEKKVTTVLKINDTTIEEEAFFFDTELFEQEEKGYYYSSNEDLVNNKPTYYNYIDITNYYPLWNENAFGDLVLHLQNPSFKYVSQKDNSLLAGDYFIIYNSTKYYFSLSNALKKEDELEIIFSYNNSGLQLYLVINQGEHILLTKDETGFKNPTNVKTLFEGIDQYLGDYKIYPNAGFVFSFVKQEGIIKPVLLLNNTEINYDKYTQFAYSFGEDSYETFISSDIHYNEPFEICYPRIVVRKNNVNYDSNFLTLQNVNSESPLIKFEDYSILTRKGHPYLTLKINNHTSVGAILQDQYKLIYPVSQANEILYQDAKEVAKENSRPRFSYSVQVSQVPSNIESFELGQLGYISDSELGVHAAQGYISQIVLVLDSPKDDEITIQNYKTKFEDLFSTITASSEAMKTNQHSYDIAASGFTSKGEIDGSILQDTFDNNKIELTYSNTNVHIDDLDGIVLTNTEPYTNGIYGQVVLRGGGIFLSNTVDSNEERIWTTGITPNGINASTITTGQLDANLVRIFAGNNLAFQWNSEGLYAYKRDEETNSYLPNTYVRYSDKGLQYLDNGFVAVDLGWNGLTINSQDGSVSLTGQNGLVVYDGFKNDDGTNYVVKLGRFGEQGSYTYGLRLYKKNEEGNYNETLITSNNGQLWLKDYLSIGNSNNAYIKSYKWQYREPNSLKWRNSPLTSANTPTLLIPANSLTRDNFVYRCIITTSDEKEIISKEVTLKMLEDANFYIRKHPRDAVVSEDSVVNYQVTAIGNNLRYQWQYSKDGGFSWENSQDAGSNTDTLTVKAVLAPNNLNGVKYRVIVTNENDEIEYSDSATLTINNNISEPIIIKQPSNVAAKLNSNGVTIEVDVLEALTNSGISGLNEQGIKSVRFWAGDDFSARSSAPFRVLHDGTVVATKIFIGEDSTINDIRVAEVTQVTELAQVKEGQVVIADGKVTANSIAANAITTNAIAANAITAEKISSNFDLEIGAGRSINITTEGSFTIESDNFKVNADGDVSLTGEITAKSGSIGGWSIDEYGLYSGEGTTRVSLNSNGEGENANYAIWAGANEPQTTTIVDGKEITTYAPFSVTRDGRVYLTKIMALASETDTTPTVVDLSSNYWQIWAGYSHSVKVLEVQGDTLNIELYNGTKVNFNKAAVNSQNYTILFGGSGVNLTAQLYKNGSTPVPISGVYSSASLALEKDASGSYANGKVTISTVNSAPNTPMASISIAPVYEAGIDFAKTKIGINTNIETKTLQIDESIYIRAQATYDGNGIGNTLETATISAPTTADIISNLSVTLDPAQDTTLDFGETLTITAIPKYNEKSGTSEYILIKAPDGTERYNQGWNECLENCEQVQAFEVTDDSYKETMLFENVDGTYIARGYGFVRGYTTTYYSIPEPK